MSKPKIYALDYIRGISMLGVVGIHTGAYSLSNPGVNIHLFALLEIFTRFSVPIFFFVSAFGLFIRQDVYASFDYKNFFLRRIRTVLVPYAVWSLFYMLHYTFVSSDTSIWHTPLLYEYILFGFASCQLYFLVIMLWFYALMPLWRLLMRQILRFPLLSMGVLLVLQIIFNYYSSYGMHIETSNPYWQRLINYRLNYLVLHYVFIFLLGALCALRLPDFLRLTERYWQTIKIFFYFTLTGILGFYYYLLTVLHYTPEQAVNTAHQLSPIGVLYTLGATLFFFRLFNSPALPAAFIAPLTTLGTHSYLVYLIHPFFMYHLNDFLVAQRIILSAPVVIAFYLMTAAASLLFAQGVEKLSCRWPQLSLILTGSRPAVKK